MCLLPMHQVLAIFILLASVDGKPNVLFLVSDDLRPEIGAFQTETTPWLNPEIQTPNLNALASRSLVMRRTYTQNALCNPSRASVMTGRRSDTTKVYDQLTYWRDAGGNFTTLPQYFKENGYYTAAAGKLYQPGPGSGYNDPLSWSEPNFIADGSMQGWDSWRMVTPEEREQTPLPDDQITYHAMETLERLAGQDQPFFLAVGFLKPHLPFVVPEEYFELYPEDSIKLPNNPYVPMNMPDVAWCPYDELRYFDDIAEIEGLGIINVTMPDTKTLELRRAYYASVSYMDNMLGVLLQKLEALGLGDDTIISFYGDHGWNLGENCEWTKITNFELAVHVPMMIHIPGLTDGGIVTDHFTELVDLLPTIVEAADLPQLEICPEDSREVPFCREGDSLFPLMTETGIDWKDAAFSQTARPAVIGPPEYMGYSVRIGDYRYTEWPRWVNSDPDWTDLGGVELYDYKVDPEGNYNYAGQEDYIDLGKQLSERLRQGWKPVNYQQTRNANN